MSTIESPHPDIATPELKIVFSIKFEIGTPVVVPNGPKGTRVCIPVNPGGKFQGGSGLEDFYGDIIAPSSDWATMYDDEPGLVLDVRFIFQTHDGKMLLAFVNGRSKRQEGDSTRAEIHSGIHIETGAEEYKWMNKKVFCGKGRKEGTTIRVNYYEIL
jgi:hypothetical protein